MLDGRTCFFVAPWRHRDLSLARPALTDREIRKESRRAARLGRPQFEVRSCWPVLVPILFALWAYYGALHGAFVFDDVPAVKDNYALEKIGGFWEAAYGPKHSPVSNRPLVTLTLALNYAAGGLNTFGYHLVNLAIHCLNGALLFGVVRR